MEKLVRVFHVTYLFNLINLIHLILLAALTDLPLHHLFVPYKWRYSPNQPKRGNISTYSFRIESLNFSSTECKMIFFFKLDPAQYLVSYLFFLLFIQST